MHVIYDTVVYNKMQQQIFDTDTTPSVWVFITQLVEHCSANSEAMGSNPIEAEKNLFFGLLRYCLNCDSTAIAQIFSNSPSGS